MGKAARHKRERRQSLDALGELREPFFEACRMARLDVGKELAEWDPSYVALWDTLKAVTPPVFDPAGKASVEPLLRAYARSLGADRAAEDAFVERVHPYVASWEQELERERAATA